jgi:tRNA(fMet)-specific endonuclease VapC
MKYLLDTDHISCRQRASGAEFRRLTARMASHPISDFALSVVSFHEQVIGAHNFINRAQTNRDMIRGYALLLEILQGFRTAPILPYDEQAVDIFTKLREQRIKVATMDLRIASIALSRNLILLTRNLGDFNKVPGLVTEDWTSL